MLRSLAVPMIRFWVLAAEPFVPRAMTRYRLRLLPACAISLLLLAAAGPFVAPLDPNLVDLNAAFIAPNLRHWMGTDDLGRDILSRLLAGAPATLILSVVVVASSSLLGILYAALATLAPPNVERALIRFCHVTLAIPPIIMAMAIVALLGPSLVTLVATFTLTMWPSTALMMNAAINITKQASYVEAARMSGATRTQILVRHIIPNSIDAIYVQSSLEISGVIVLMAGLSYLGIGAAAPSPDWGSMIASGQDFITTNWWITAFPGLAITLSALVFALLGDALRETMDKGAAQ